MGKPADGLWQAETTRLIQKYFDDPESEPFHEPVLWKEWDLPDYPKIVKEPMDLGTVKSNMEQGKYKSFDEFVRHMRLIWSNCMAYNADGSDLYKVALKLKRKFDRDLARVTKKLDPSAASASGSISGSSGATPSRVNKFGKTPSQKEVAEFCRLVYEIDEVQLGELIINIEETCESALRKRASDDVDLLVDRIDVANFRRLELMLRQFTEQNNSSKAARKKTDAGVKRPASSDADVEDAAEPAKKAKSNPSEAAASAAAPAGDSALLSAADSATASSGANGTSAPAGAGSKTN